MSQFMLSPREGKSVWLGGLGVDFKIAGEQTGGLFSIVEHPIDPGVLVPPHTHTREDEFSYVLEGEVGARIGDQVLQATPGCYIVKPRGVLHTFWNAGPQPARLLEIISPAGFEKFFMELADLLGGDGPPDFEKIAQLGNRYGQTYDMNWVPELTAKYNLKLLGEAR
jgi:quercetin dioxygenase-like cupin family protein